MKEANLAGLDAWIAGGSDGDGGGDGPVVVLLHGFGAPGDDLVPLWRVIPVTPPRTVRYVFPAAPLLLPPPFAGGARDDDGAPAARAWWWIDLEAKLRGPAGGLAWDVREVPSGLAQARDQVGRMLDEIPRVLGGSAAKKLVLGGFSQGAMLSLDVALRSERTLAGLVLLSGTHIASEEWAVHLGAGSRRGLPVFMSHGTQDSLLPFGVAEALGRTLAASGMTIEWVPFRGGHEIPLEVTAALGAFLSRRA